MGAVIGIDAGNTKTELVAADLAGVPTAYLRGPGMNVHGLGAEACVAALGRLVDDHLARRRDASQVLWPVLAFGLWLDHIRGAAHE